MSRHYPGAESRSGSDLARHRWAASLGPARDDVLLDDVLLDEVPGDGGPAREAAAPDATPSEGPAAAAFRWRTGRRAAALLALICVLLGGWFWWQAADGAPRVQPLGEPPGSQPADPVPAVTGSQTAVDGGSAGAGDTAGAAVPGAPGGRIVVHVAGAVASPGVLELAGGSRLHEAIKAAGGSTATADLDRLNLAAVLEDGQKILVPERGSPDGAGAAEAAAPSAGADGTRTDGTGSGAGTGPQAAKINLNTAGAEELATLPRVGPVLAQRILDWRKQHGKFSSVEELDAVEGVGPKLLAALLPLVRI